MSLSYSATMIDRAVTDKNKFITCGGSFCNIRIDGRHSLETAINVARDIFKKEASFSKSEYLGFAIEKTSRFVDYKNPVIVDNKVKAKEVLFLL